MTHDPRGGWAYCNDCGRVVPSTRLGVYEKHTVDPDMTDECPGSGRIASDGCPP